MSVEACRLRYAKTMDGRSSVAFLYAKKDASDPAIGPDNDDVLEEVSTSASDEEIENRGKARKLVLMIVAFIKLLGRKVVSIITILHMSTFAGPL